MTAREKLCNENFSLRVGRHTWRNTRGNGELFFCCCRYGGEEEGISYLALISVLVRKAVIVFPSTGEMETITVAQEASPATLEDLPAPDMAASSGATGKDGGWRFRVPEDSSTPIPLKRVLFLSETPAAMGALQRRYGAGECCGGEPVS